MKQLIGLGVGLAIVIGAGYLLIQNSARTPSDELLRLWEQDLRTLAEKKQLPPAFAKIREVRLKAGDAEAAKITAGLQPPIPTSPDGEYDLEVLALSWEEAPESGIILQYDLINKATGNYVLEFGRTFTLQKP